MKYQKAIDLILQFAGETPVNAPNEHPLQGVIERFLEGSMSREQLLDWWFNTDEDLWLQPDEVGKVPISSQVKKVIFYNSDYVDRGDFVYDKKNQTYLINTNVEVLSTVRVLDWDELPELMQQWITFQAAKYYILGTIGDTGITKELKEEAARTFILLKKQDIESKNINVFNTPQIAKARSGRKPYVRR